MTQWADTMGMRFDIYTVKMRGNTPIATFLFVDISLTVAEIMSDAERDEFDDTLLAKGWFCSCPGWNGFKPLVVMPHGDLLRNDQFKYLMELAS